jgi:hypothetical protein
VPESDIATYMVGNDKRTTSETEAKSETPEEQHTPGVSRAQTPEEQETPGVAAGAGIPGVVAIKEEED